MKDYIVQKDFHHDGKFYRAATETSPADEISLNDRQARSYRIGNFISEKSIATTVVESVEPVVDTIPDTVEVKEVLKKDMATKPKLVKSDPSKQTRHSKSKVD